MIGGILAIYVMLNALCTLTPALHLYLTDSQVASDKGHCAQLAADQLAYGHCDRARDGHQHGGESLWIVMKLPMRARYRPEPVRIYVLSV